MHFALFWDTARFPLDVLFPDGLDGWPSWLDDAVSHLASTGKAYDWDSVWFENAPPYPLVLTATEPNLKGIAYAVTLVPGTSGDVETLTVSDVRRA